MKKIFYAEDDAAIARSVQEYLLQQDYEVDIFPTAARTRQALLSETPDLILVDWNLPDENGDGLCRWIRRRWESLPVIFLTVRNDAADVISGFETGADDYVTKPFAPMELMARVNSHLRRYSRYLNLAGRETKQEQEHVYTIGGLELNEDAVEVTVDGNPVSLTPLEFKILALLMKHPGRVFSPEEIYERIWNEKAIATETIMVHIRNIRSKIEVNPKNPKYIKVVWGVGYKIEKQ